MLEEIARYGSFVERIKSKKEEIDKKEEIATKSSVTSHYSKEELALQPVLCGDEFDDILHCYYSRPLLRRF